MKQVIDFLTENNTTVIATSLNDKPRASILEYAMIGDSMIFSTDKNSIKALNLTANPHVSLSVQKLPVFVTIDGTVTMATDAEKAEYDRKLVENHPEFKEMLDSGMMNDYAYFKIKPETAYLSDMSKGPEVEIIKM